MQRLHRSAPTCAAGLLIVLTLSRCSGGSGAAAAAQESAAAGTTIGYRQFSAAPSLGNGPGWTDPRRDDYGALAFFVQNAQTATAALGDGRAVRLSLTAGGASLADVAKNAYAAAYTAGSSLNPVWGFIYNSVPFGPTFTQYISFLYDGGGVALANRLLADRKVDVVAFPVVGSPGQVSGYFKKPVGIPECPATGDDECRSHGAGIGLEGMCAEPWTLRYLPPAETVVNLACTAIGRPQRLAFVQAVPGGSALLTAMQQGKLDGLEFATALDDLDAAKGGFFVNAAAPAGSDGRNAGEIGVRFAHFPSWHQPFYLGWFLINKSQVWDRLAPDQQAAIRDAARAALMRSYDASTMVQCDALRDILDVNDTRQQSGPNRISTDTGLSADVRLTRWNDADLERLKRATQAFLDATAGGATPTNDEQDYRTVMAALTSHLGYGSTAEMLGAWKEPEFPVPGGCAR
jgi:TRAP-type mannitol/chloroaromatic compound transport system substrate-binding protein